VADHHLRRGSAVAVLDARIARDALALVAT
jgi:hypothetical protein